MCDQPRGIPPRAKKNTLVPSVSRDWVLQTRWEHPLFGSFDCIRQQDPRDLIGVIHEGPLFTGSTQEPIGSSRNRDPFLKSPYS